LLSSYITGAYTTGAFIYYSFTYKFYDLNFMTSANNASSVEPYIIVRRLWF